MPNCDSSTDGDVNAGRDKGLVLGIIEAGRPPPELASKLEPYPQLFRQLLGEYALSFRDFAALDGDIPQDPTSCDAWLISGSRYGAYDDEPWIAALEDFVRHTIDARTPLVGICFGHQLIAQALGGKVVKSARGWGVGVHTYQVVERPMWMKDPPRSFAIQAFHQDQVVRIPNDAQVVAESEFCPYAVLAYGDYAFTVQGHPEFDSNHAEALLLSRRGIVVDEALADAALANIHEAQDADQVGRWIASFLAHAQSGRSPIVDRAER